MEKYENIKYDPIEIYLKDTISFFSDLKILKKGKIISKYDTIHDIEIEFLKDGNSINYKTASFKKIDQSTEHFGFGLLEPFEIIIGAKKYILKNGVKSTKFQYSQFTTSGKITEIESNITSDIGFYRAIFQIDGFTKTPNKYFWTKPFKIGQNIRGAGYLEMKINEYNLGFYDYEIEKQSYIFIDCHTQTTINEFEKLLESTIYSFALISGCLIRDVKNILKFKNNNFTDLEGFSIKKIGKSVITNMELYNYREYQTYSNTEGLYFFPKNVFSNLVQSCHNNNMLLRAIRIICQSRNQPVEIEAASIFVALETVKEIIIKNNIEKVSPFKDQEFAKNIIGELKTKIDSIDEIHFNSKSTALGKINNLNQVGNNESFKLAFELVGFKLTKNDLKFISMRNRFLHGTMPYDDEIEEIRIKELSRISFSVHFLTCCLILKFVGYNGIVKNFLKYLDLINSIDEVEEELFISI